MNYNYVDIPQKYDLDVYTTCINKYIEIVKEITGILAIYQIGSINTPGISDIDLVVVVDEQFNSLDFSRLSVKRVFTHDPIALYLFTHDVFVLNKESFININYIAYFTEVKHLYGEEIFRENLGAEEEKVVYFSILADFVISRLHQFRTVHKSDTISIRNNLIRISSLRHSIALGKRIGIKYDFKKIEKEIDSIRKHWFEEEDIEAIKNLFVESIKFFLIIIEEANKVFQREYLCFADDRYKELLLMMVDGKNLTLFSNIDSINEKDISSKLEEDLDKVSSGYNNVLIYPRELFFHYLTYIEVGDDYFRQKLKEKLINCNLNFGVQKIYKDTLKKRCLFLSNFYRFLNENKITFSNLAGYPGFNMIDH